MGKLRHIALQVPDPWKAAEFYMQAFGMTKVGETDWDFAEDCLVTHSPPGVLNAVTGALGIDDFLLASANVHRRLTTSRRRRRPQFNYPIRALI